MIEFDKYYNRRGPKSKNLKPIIYTKEISKKVEEWDYFTGATIKVINYINDQSDALAARDIAINWYKSCIKLGKLYYNVQETTEQIYNNLPILIKDVNSANFPALQRTFLNTFSNVARYQKNVV